MALDGCAMAAAKRCNDGAITGNTVRHVSTVVQTMAPSHSLPLLAALFVRLAQLSLQCCRCQY